ncbi:MAG: chemotaxis protein CheW [Methylococcaceae bacterium]|jgi:chemotaxis signal transduction protein|nr:chemotaxis protein CheW [Methylococcaceae bacterium]
MQHILFRVGPEIFAIPADDINAVLPMPTLEHLANAPEHFVGLLRYQDRLVPVLDVNVLQGQPPCRPVISTRILLVSSTEGALGLLVEQAMEMMDLRSPQILPNDLLVKDRDWLTPEIFDTDLGLVQSVRWRALLTSEWSALAVEES